MTMNTQFNLARFCRLFVYEHRSSSFLPYATMLIVFYSIAVWVLNLFVVTIDVEAGGVTPFSEKFVTLAGYLSVAFYHPLLRKEKRNLYTALPVSSLEKYISVAINTLVVIPASFVILSTIISLVAALIVFGGEIPGLEFRLPSLLSLCIHASIISIVTYLYFSSMSRKHLLQGLVIISIYWFSGPLRRDLQEAGHICFHLFIIAFMQLLIYSRIKNIE